MMVDWRTCARTHPFHHANAADTGGYNILSK
jgi:hypothetical protein